MNATITRPGKSPRKVKNLGWLLSHWKEVAKFEVNPPLVKDTNVEALLRAHLKDGGEYTVTFASASVLWDFLHRPVFFGLPLQWMFGAYREIIRGESFERGTLPSVGSADKPYEYNGNQVYRDGPLWYMRNPKSGWEAMRSWRLVTDPALESRLNSSLDALVSQKELA